MGISSIDKVAVAGLLERSVGKNSQAFSNTLEKLATGYRVNKASDDVAALALGSRLNAENVQLQVYQQNTTQASSLVQIADGALDQQLDITTRLKELAVQASSDTLSDGERGALNVEFQALTDELTRVAADTKFNDQELLATPGGTSFDFTVGDNDAITADLDESTANSLGLDVQDISTKAGADAALAAVDSAAESIITNRANVGAVSNRLESAQGSLAVTSENVDAARSAFLDANLAQEVSRKAATEVLLKTSLSTLAQGNSNQSNLLSLLS